MGPIFNNVGAAVDGPIADHKMETYVNETSEWTPTYASGDMFFLKNTKYNKNLGSDDASVTLEEVNVTIYLRNNNGNGFMAYDEAGNVLGYDDNAKNFHWMSESEDPLEVYVYMLIEGDYTVAQEEDKSFIFRKLTSLDDLESGDQCIIVSEIPDDQGEVFAHVYDYHGPVEADYDSEAGELDITEFLNYTSIPVFTLGRDAEEGEEIGDETPWTFSFYYNDYFSYLYKYPHDFDNGYFLTYGWASADPSRQWQIVPDGNDGYKIVAADDESLVIMVNQYGEFLCGNYDADNRLCSCGEECDCATVCECGDECEDDCGDECDCEQECECPKIYPAISHIYVRVHIQNPSYCIGKTTLTAPIIEPEDICTWEPINDVYYRDPIYVTITSNNEEPYELYYTTDGSDPRDPENYARRLYEGEQLEDDYDFLMVNAAVLKDGKWSDLTSRIYARTTDNGDYCKVYEKVTSADQLRSGADYILVYENELKYLGSANEAVDGPPIYDDKVNIAGYWNICELNLRYGGHLNNNAYYHNDPYDVKWYIENSCLGEEYVIRSFVRTADGDPVDFNGFAVVKLEDNRNDANQENISAVLEYNADNDEFEMNEEWGSRPVPVLYIQKELSVGSLRSLETIDVIDEPISLEDKNLIVAWAYGGTEDGTVMWCKDVDPENHQPTSLTPTYINRGVNSWDNSIYEFDFEQIDYNDALGFGPSHDQNNWIKLVFPDDEYYDYNTCQWVNVSTLEGLCGYVVKPGTIKGVYEGHINYQILMSSIPEVDKENEEYKWQYPGPKCGWYPCNTVYGNYNFYTPCNFVSKNLNPPYDSFEDDGYYGYVPGAVPGPLANEEHTYDENGDLYHFFFMNPKEQEVCQMWGRWLGDDIIRIYYHKEPSQPNNNTWHNAFDIEGVVQVNWKYNRLHCDEQDYGQPFCGDHYYNNINNEYIFHAVVERRYVNEEQADHKASDYIIYPLDLRCCDNPTSSGEVKIAPEVVSVRYYNILGQGSDEPFEGINIIEVRYSDDSTVTKKVIF